MGNEISFNQRLISISFVTVNIGSHWRAIYLWNKKYLQDFQILFYNLNLCSLKYIQMKYSKKSKHLDNVEFLFSKNDLKIYQVIVWKIVYFLDVAYSWEGILFCLLIFAVLWIRYRALCMLSKHFVTELHAHQAEKELERPSDCCSPRELTGRADMRLLFLIKKLRCL